MQWQPVFENPLIDKEVRALSADQARRLLASYLYRQFRLVRSFDQRYQSNLQDLFVRQLSVAVAGSAAGVELGIGEVYAAIPDTDEYAQQEGAYAQNLMIALWYLLSFAHEPDTELLQAAANAALNNVDLLNHELDEHYDESAVVAREVVVVRQMLRRMRAGAACSGDVAVDIADLAGGLAL
ncbi:hypothetical protein NRB16_26900 [Pseudomonas sp. LJDD11]|nr:hypothetical protein [Pseudomonas sp. LJDD11]MCQ9427146.1 hypothetical protein [Pseudomonas sp. LJDD11]